ncbi:3767_t:CDS:1, partial [Dentiscutata heterogama]
VDNELTLSGVYKFTSLNGNASIATTTKLLETTDKKGKSTFNPASRKIVVSSPNLTGKCTQEEQIFCNWNFCNMSFQTKPDLRKH